MLKRNFCAVYESGQTEFPLIINGTNLAKNILQRIQTQVHDFEKCYHRKPGLAVILVKYKPQSMVYTQLKAKKAHKLGIQSVDFYLNESETTKQSLIDLIEELNHDDHIDGILLQLPLPPSLSTHTNDIVDHISPLKDIDGLTSKNQGILTKYGRHFIQDNLHNLHYDEIDATNCRQYMNFPCTPLAVVHILEYLQSVDRRKYEIQCKNIVMIGRSCLVGTPLSLMLSAKNATVTLCHSYTDQIPHNLNQHCSRADIIVVAAGSPNLITSASIKPGCIVIDVGTNVMEHKQGSAMKITGDVSYEQVKHLTSAITPVPGGVGPLTVAMLFKNTIRAAKCRQLLQQRESQTLVAKRKRNKL